jgi:plastocyanin
MQRLTTSTLILAATLVVVNCGGGGGPTNPSSGGGGGGGPTPGSNVVTVTIKGVNGKLSFDPNPAMVQSGQVVVFRNADVVTHRVVLDNGSIDSGDIPPGASSQPMSVGGLNASYHCPIHPSMVGSFNGAATPEPPPCTGYGC